MQKKVSRRVRKRPQRDGRSMAHNQRDGRTEEIIARYHDRPTPPSHCSFFKKYCQACPPANRVSLGNFRLGGDGNIFTHTLTFDHAEICVEDPSPAWFHVGRRLNQGRQHCFPLMSDESIGP